MALISCLTRPDGLQGVFSCLSIGQGLSGFLVLIILLVGWLVIQYLAEARRVRRTRKPDQEYPSRRHNLVMPVMHLLCMTLLTRTITR